ncbi:MAG: type II secretion system protein N [Steroidobacteraceae bacterium]
MRKLILLALLGLGVFLLVFLIRLPASKLSQFTPAGVGLQAPSGTVWHGSADLLVDDWPAGRLAWRFRPMALFKLELRYEWTWSIAGGGISGTLEVVRSETRLRNLRGELPVEPFAAQLGAPAWTGRLEFDLDEMTLGRNGHADAAGELRLVGLTGRLGSPLSLGDFRWRPDAPGRSDRPGTWRGFAEDAGDGPLRLRSTLEFDARGRYRLAGDLSVSNSASASEAGLLDSVLRAYGAPDQEGRYPFIIQSR